MLGCHWEDPESRRRCAIPGARLRELGKAGKCFAIGIPVVLLAIALLLNC